MKGTIFSVEICKTEVTLTPEEKHNFIKTIKETSHQKSDRRYDSTYEDTLFDKCPELDKVFEAAVKLAKDDLGIDMVPREYWAHIHEKNMSTDIHSHSEYGMACVYYLNVPRGSGDIVFAPVTNTNHMNIMKSVEGELLMFPGWVKHKVTRHLGEEERISVSFNLYPTDFIAQYGNPEN